MWTYVTYFFTEKCNNQRKYFWKGKILITYDVNFARLKMQHLLYTYGFTAFILSRKIQMFPSQKHRTLSEKVNILCARNYLINFFSFCLDLCNGDVLCVWQETFKNIFCGDDSAENNLPTALK